MNSLELNPQSCHGSVESQGQVSQVGDIEESRDSRDASAPYEEGGRNLEVLQLLSDGGLKLRRAVVPEELYGDGDEVGRPLGSTGETASSAHRQDQATEVWLRVKGSGQHPEASVAHGLRVEILLEGESGGFF